MTLCRFVGSDLSMAPPPESRFGDAEGLFGASQIDLGDGMRGVKRAIPPDSAERRKTLSRSDYIAVQGPRPHNPTAIDEMSLSDLWKVISSGNDWTSYFSYLADPDRRKQGVAISQFAQVMKHAIDHLKRPRLKNMIKDDVYERIISKANIIYPHFEVLDGGSDYWQQRGRTVHLSSGINRRPPKDVDAVTASAKAIHTWLMEPQCPLRAWMAISSGNGIVYVAQCDEKSHRAYLRASGSVTISQDVYAAAAVERLCTSGGMAPMPDGERDDLALTQG